MSHLAGFALPDLDTLQKQINKAAEAAKKQISSYGASMMQAAIKPIGTMASQAASNAADRATNTAFDRAKPYLLGGGVLLAAFLGYKLLSKKGRK